MAHYPVLSFITVSSLSISAVSINGKVKAGESVVTP